MGRISMVCVTGCTYGRRREREPENPRARAMIPSVVAAEVTGALRDFLATGFGPSNPTLAHVIDDLLSEAAS